MGAKFGHITTQETRNKISKANLGNTPWCKGKKFSEEHRRKLSEAHKNPTEEQRRRMSEAQKNQSEESRAKRASAMKGEKNWGWKGGISIGKNAKEYIYIKTLERIARKKGAKGNYTLDEWRGLKKKYNYMCLCCKRFEPEIKLTMDHVIPLSLGGNNDINNIQPLCGSCNSRKFIDTTDYRLI